MNKNRQIKEARVAEIKEKLEKEIYGQFKKGEEEFSPFLFK